VPTTTLDIIGFKERGERFAMFTAYDCPTGRLLDEVGVPLILVGDTLADNVLGYETTVPVTMEEMLHHTRAVNRGAKEALVIGDLPFGSYHTSIEDGIRNGCRLMKEGGARAVKFEGPWPGLAAALVTRGAPVMGHLGLTPQSVHALGGYRVQGRKRDAADRLVQDARRLEEAGVFALVLECVPIALAKEITLSLAIPTIGIGAGPHCDGQVLVLTDLLGINERKPRFVKAYANLADEIRHAARQFQAEVREGVFPDEAHAYS
jgi:3-methyl-2-oxobutanoate hydroxymethyltransferase